MLDGACSVSTFSPYVFRCVNEINQIQSDIIKSFKKSFCLICIGLFDFSWSDSWISVTERWLVSVVEPSRSERRHKPKTHAQKHVRGRHVFKLFLLILWLWKNGGRSSADEMKILCWATAHFSEKQEPEKFQKSTIGGMRAVGLRL